MTFQLDTSGAVLLPHPTPEDPFTQGYIEAALKGYWRDRWRELQFGGEPDSYPYAFSDLAPETRARIIADCETAHHFVSEFDNTREDGARFWKGGERLGEPSAFPPLTIQLGDDGKVRFYEGAA